jgi:hypothetical protein
VSIPSEHLERLEEELSGHESWLRTLRRQIEGLEAEASAHETVLRLGRNRELHRVLGELHKQPELSERIAEDPRSFFEQQGIEVPDGATLTVTTDPEGSGIEARFEDPYLSYGVGWSRVKGFYMIQAETPESTDAPTQEAP